MQTVIVNSCNLSCPTCYADSPLGAGHKLDAVPLQDLQRRIQGVVDRKGGIEILQLSGGEPTLMAYGGFRFLHEFFREEPTVIGPFTGYQIAALAVAALGTVGFARRQNNLPATIPKTPA